MLSLIVNAFVQCLELLCSPYCKIGISFSQLIQKELGYGLPSTVYLASVFERFVSLFTFQLPSNEPKLTEMKNIAIKDNVKDIPVDNLSYKDSGYELRGNS